MSIFLHLVGVWVGPGFGTVELIFDTLLGGSHLLLSKLRVLRHLFDGHTSSEGLFSPGRAGNTRSGFVLAIGAFVLQSTAGVQIPYRFAVAIVGTVIGRGNTDRIQGRTTTFVLDESELAHLVSFGGLLFESFEYLYAVCRYENLYCLE